MPDFMPNSSAPAPYAQGVSNPPNGGNVTSVETPPSEIQTPGAAGMGGASAPPPASPGPNPQQVAQAATLAHAAKTGLGWHALMGTHTEYQPTGPGGSPVAVPVQNSASQLFRSILAGAIMGGAAGGGISGEKTAGSGWAGAAAGAGAARAGMEQQQQQAQQQAQQEWQNKLTNQKEVRDQQGFETEQQVRRAQIAQANAETLRANILTQGSSFAQHQDVVNADKDRISTFTNAGVKPVFSDIPESKMNDIIKNSPGASALDWRHTGVKTGVGADGQPTYEYTLSAYDPKASAPLSQATIDQWKDDGLFKYHPEYMDVVKPGRILSVNQFTELDRQSQNLQNQDIAKQKQDLEIKKDQAAINADNARVAEAYSSIAKNRAETAQVALGKTQSEQFNTALDDLNKAGGDFSKLKPSSRVVISESMNKMVPVLNQEYKDLSSSVDPGDQQKAKDVLQQIQTLTTLGTRALGSIGEGAGGKVLHPEVVSILTTAIPGFDPTTAQKIANLPPDQIVTQLAGANIPEDVKAKILAVYGKSVPPAPPIPQPWGQHSTPAQDIQRGVQNAPTPTPQQAAVTF